MVSQRRSMLFLKELRRRGDTGALYALPARLLLRIVIPACSNIRRLGGVPAGTGYPGPSTTSTTSDRHPVRGNRLAKHANTRWGSVVRDSSRSVGAHSVLCDVLWVCGFCCAISTTSSEGDARGRVVSLSVLQVPWERVFPSLENEARRTERRVCVLLTQGWRTRRGDGFRSVSYTE